MIFSNSVVVSTRLLLATIRVADVSVNDPDLILRNITKKAWEVPAGEVDTLTRRRGKACLEEYISTPIPTITIKQRLFSSAVFLLYVSINSWRIRLIDPGKWSPFPQDVHPKRSSVRVP